MKKLKAYRKQKGLTQSEMADRLDISRKHYLDIENGNVEPSKPLRQLIEIHIGERCCGAYSSDAGCCNKE